MLDDEIPNRKGLSRTPCPRHDLYLARLIQVNCREIVVEVCRECLHKQAVSFKGDRTPLPLYRDNRRACCKARRWGESKVIRLIARNGSESFWLTCPMCDQRWCTTSKTDHLGQIRTPDETIDNRSYIWNDPQCEVCGSRDGVEWHHWAPKHLFGDEANNWPTSDLCPTCHRRWHAIVTPLMGRKAS